ncbi:MAG: AMP-binding protein [Actinomycetia bacterium]|nr:AMP-binding protein [Actinomycetes bacterium]
MPGPEAIVAAGRRTDYTSLDAGVDRLTRGLLELGAGHGERVALWVSNREEYLLAYLACARNGATLVPLNMRLGASEVEYVLVHSGAGVLVLQEAFDGRERRARSRRHARRTRWRCRALRRPALCARCRSALAR